MKFLCDRCKTRYSIGDDRVRGKILKIRCKNCANVITVREGMPDADAAEAAAPGGGAGEAGADPRRAHKSTTAAPVIQSEAPANGALGAAFASAMTKPPPALEEEWYVSIDGDQSGPFSLAEAQRWIAGQPPDADLHCWSEGFDDWLPVDKVSHFRGLRKRPPTPAPPPVPRAPTAAARSIAPRTDFVSEETPKPLFAATMASLEKGSSPALPVDARGPLAGLPTPMPARPATPIAGARPTATPPKGVSPVEARSSAPSGPVSAPHTNGSAARPIPTAKPLPGFDTSEPADPATQIDSPVFPERPAALGAPAPLGPPAALASPAPTAPPATSPDDDDLDIGEVSRVVNLADLARSARASAGPQSATRRTGAQPIVQPAARISSPKLGGGTGAVPPIHGFGQGGSLEAPGAPVAPEGAIRELAPPPPVSHKRGMIALVAGAIALIGAAVVVVVVVSSGDDKLANGRLNSVGEIDTTRPDDIRIARPDEPAGSGSATDPSPITKKPGTQGQTSTVRPPQTKDPVIAPPAGGNSLRADE
ncbi:MAG: GYF domain-containing protein, partial [Kofleriaceae bacterium]